MGSPRPVVATRRVDPTDAMARACRNEYVLELSRRLSDFVEENADMVDDEDLVPPKGVLLLATCDGMPAGSGALKTLERGVGEVKHLYVSDAFRGRGIATALLSHLEDEARELGFERVRLDSAAELHEAISLYRKFGYLEIARYNDNPYAAVWFEKDLSVPGAPPTPAQRGESGDDGTAGALRRAPR